MLTYLRIRNLALVDDVALEPGPGLTVFTGETGAGKSIILDGLALAVGERASLDMVRGGADEAEVEALFSLGRDPEVVRLLEDAGLAGADDALVVRRRVGGSGSRAWVNDSVSTVGGLKALGDRLVDIHGQHEHQSLLSATAHREFLDRYAEAQELLRRVREAYDEATDIRERLERLRADDRERQQRLDYLKFQVDEIEAARLQAGEDEELASERQRLAHAEELARTGDEAVGMLYEGEGAVVDLLRRCERRLERLAELDSSTPVGAEPLAEARFAVEELARELRRYVEGLSIDPARLEAVEERLAVIDRLRRKYGDSVAEVLERAAEARRELEELENRDEQIEELEARLGQVGERYREAARELAARRREAAGQLERQVSEELGELGMEGAELRVEIRALEDEAPAGLPAGANRQGGERVEFHLAANPGEPAGPLARVASGGELSRVMLALKLVAADDDPIETLVFDEVDAGIGGGRVAEQLARRLATMARSHQVLVVTHLAQVAAYADRHFRVLKEEREGRVRARVVRLEADERVEEVARMLGGVEITDTTRRHARELLGS